MTTCQHTVMYRNIAVLLVLLLYILPASAQEEPKRSFWSHGVGKLLKKADDLVARMQEEGVDTAYIRKPERDRMWYLGYYWYFQQHDMTFPININDADVPYPQECKPSNMEEKKYVKADMHTYQSEAELGIDWRGISLELPIPIRNKYSLSLGLAKTGSVWGARLRYKSINRMEGVLDDAYNQAMQQWQTNILDGTNSPAVTEPSTIPAGRLGLKILYAEGYYVFNNRRFSLAAGLYGDMIQKRSAGSLFIMANYYQSQFSANNLFNYENDVFRNWKISIGPGYGYNWSMLNGRICLHTSVIPMISIKNHLVHNGKNIRNKYAQLTPSQTTGFAANVVNPENCNWENYDSHYYDAVDDGRSNFVFNGFARIALSYSFERFLLNFMVNYRQYLYRNNADTKINNREVDGQVNIGYRF